MCPSNIIFCVVRVVIAGTGVVDQFVVFIVVRVDDDIDEKDDNGECYV